MPRAFSFFSFFMIAALALTPVPVLAITQASLVQNPGTRAGLPFLFFAYAFVFLGLVAYILVLSRRQRELEREIQALRRSLLKPQQEPNRESPALEK